jgi:hypothetical protein
MSLAIKFKTLDSKTFEYIVNSNDTIESRIENIKDLFNGKLNYTIETSNLIKQFGNKYIKRMIIVRTPLSMPMPQSLNAVSGFNFF